jgi:hypothetical protein
MELGTHRDNANDKMARGRHPVGQNSYHAKLKNTDIPVIRARLSAGHRKVDIAADYEVSPTSIWQIASGRAWKYS